MLFQTPLQHLLLPTLETLVSFEKLRASDCCNGLSHVTKLQTLSFHFCFELEEILGVEHLRSLKGVLATECPILQWGEEVE